MTKSFTLPAFAKINLSLRVLGRRADGYHEIRTLFQTITLCDRLTFSPNANGEFQLACSDPALPTDDTNLVVRAAAALRERFGVRKGARIRLEKTIPAGGGLGGGSTDAAAALIGLAGLWDIDTTKDELSEIAARLGADVPFFLTGGTALGTGTGTSIEPLADAPASRLVIITPPVHVSTAQAYKSLNAPALTKDNSAASLSVSRAKARFDNSLQWNAVNDFEPVVFRLYPEIERARDALLATGAREAMLSGSGASVFGLFNDAGEARRAAESLQRERGRHIFLTATLSRANYAGAFGDCARLLA